MYYSIRHNTKFNYSAPIRESLMELRMQPRSDGLSRCLWFDLQITPRPRVGAYRDCWDNFVHFFDVPGVHEELLISTHSIVEITVEPSFSEGNTPTWDDLNNQVEKDDYWDYLLPSKFARSSELLQGLISEWNVIRRDSPFELLQELRSNIYQNFSYAPYTTRADSPIDEALDARRGVCQDYTHIFISLAREIGIPCRYISGYLHHAETDRSQSNATHAWAEAWLPGLGWVGFDPTNNCLAGSRHVRTAVGRDYADVPPTRGIFKGRALTELKVDVEVERIAALPPEALAPAPAQVIWSNDQGSTSGASSQNSGAMAAVWPPLTAQYVDDVSEQAQQQQQQAMRRCLRSY